MSIFTDTERKKLIESGAMQFPNPNAPIIRAPKGKGALRGPQLSTKQQVNAVIDRVIRQIGDKLVNEVMHGGVGDPLPGARTEAYNETLRILHAAKL